MAFLPQPQDKKINVRETLDQHSQLLLDQNRELKEQKQITFFFTIIAGLTLVGTLVGLAGLYISAFKDKANGTADQEEAVRSLSTEVNQLRTDFLLLKAKNPSLK